MLKQKADYLIIPTLLGFFILFRYLLGFNGLYGQDSYEYLNFARSLRGFFINGTPPPDFFWPVLYPLAGAFLSLILQDVGFSLQFVSIISAAVVYIYTLKIIRLIYPESSKNANVYLLVLLLLSPFFLRFSASIMSDMMTLAALVSGTYHLFKFIRLKSVVSICLAALLCGVACMTRYAAIVLVFPLALYGLFHFFKHKTRFYILLPVILLGAIPLIPHFLIRWGSSTSFLQHDWLTTWSPFHFLKSDFITRDGIQQNAVPNIIYSLMGIFHPRYFLAGIPVLILGFRKFGRTPEVIMLAIAVAFYLLFLSGIPFQNNRFLLQVLPFFLMIYYRPTIQVLKMMGKDPLPVSRLITIFITCTAVIIQLSLFVVSFKKVYDRTMIEKEIHRFVLSKNSPPIYTMDIDVSLQSKGIDAPIYNIWLEYYEQPDTTALVIFNTNVFPKQWRGMNPMKNWDHFNEDYHLKEIKSFKEGWKAYVFN